MQMLRSSPADSERLLSLPESGMGYQIIYTWGEPYVAFNATILITLAQLHEGPFTAEDYDYLTGDPDGEKVRSLESIETQGDLKLVFNDFDADYHDGDLGLESNRNAIRPGTGVFLPNRPHSYYRFSAFYKDKRVDGKGFKPGTYATTYNDLHFVPSGFAAVGRYALPNPASAKYVFQIITFDKPDLMATATPNYSQAGGGVEVYFKSGAKNAPGCSFMINAG